MCASVPVCCSGFIEFRTSRSIGILEFVSISIRMHVCIGLCRSDSIPSIIDILDSVPSISCTPGIPCINSLLFEFRCKCLVPKDLAPISRIPRINSLLSLNFTLLVCQVCKSCHINYLAPSSRIPRINSLIFEFRCKSYHTNDLRDQSRIPCINSLIFEFRCKSLHCNDLQQYPAYPVPSLILKLWTRNTRYTPQKYQREGYILIVELM
jgi:hypothetical protein